MARLTKQDRKELQELAASAAMREDLQTLSRRCRRHFIRDGQVDIDRAVAFVIEFNEMIDHRPKPFKKILDGEMKL